MRTVDCVLSFNSIMQQLKGQAWMCVISRSAETLLYCSTIARLAVRRDLNSEMKICRKSP